METEFLESEVWRTIECAPNFEVSSMGKIRSKLTHFPLISKKGNMCLRRRCTDRVGKKLSKKGYKRINLGPNIGVKFVHRLVAEAFLGPANGLQVNHKNGIKTDNCITNLEYVSNQDNRNHAVRMGLVVRRDKNCTYQKLTTAQCMEIVEIYKRGELSQGKIAKLFGVSQQTIGAIWRKYKT